MSRPHGRVVIGGKNNASAVIEDGRKAGANGNVQAVAFTFSETGDIELGAAIVPATSFFEGFGPSALPSAKPTATPSESASGSASETPGEESGSPSDTATDEAAADH